MTNKPKESMHLSHLFEHEILYKTPETFKVKKETLETKKISIFHSADELNNQDLNFLQKVMQSVGYKLDTDCLLLNSKDHHQKLKDIKSNYILIFGDSEYDHFSKFEAYKIISKKEQRLSKFDTLESIQNSTELKKKLWNKLKEIFNK